VRRIEAEWKTGQLLKLDMINPSTREFGAQVGFELTPTFILYDAQGNEVQRWRRPPTLEELP
jgi:thioredoxin-related protein